MCLVFSGSGGKPWNTDGQTTESRSLGQVVAGFVVFLGLGTLRDGCGPLVP